MATRKRLIGEGAALAALAALAQAQRLRASRALVTAGPEGMTPGMLAARLDVGASVLSFHLKELTHAGLISSEARGRHLIYRASFDHMNALLAYLTEHCCQGAGCEAAAPRAQCAPC
jgi:ArsR family transcriptional regulator, arsenate/arsenite/antimonite-responsive transcriptional repressor